MSLLYLALGAQAVAAILLHDSRFGPSEGRFSFPSAGAGCMFLRQGDQLGGAPVPVSGLSLGEGLHADSGLADCLEQVVIVGHFVG